uniref:non-specific serine/threonine protein kinase n=1 Tax=Kalanchoe fedtschenkoi TaxID=63787 RepID=A0A7N0TUR2_KALFE
MSDGGRGFVIYLVLIVSLVSLINVADAWLLSCGNADGGTDSDGRKWVSDSKFFKSKSNHMAETASYQDPSLPSTVPYMTARLFMSDARYQVPVKSSQRYWIRLHFYPATYASFDLRSSYFSVVVNGVTLLSNFSASITAQALTQAYIVKEYALAAMDTDVLEIKFNPRDSGSFAFVNGIEVVPVPDGLFGSAALVGFSDQSVDEQTTDLQTMVRLNVGGQYIGPANDTNRLSRTWYEDTPYVYGAVLGVTSEADTSVMIQYKDVPQYAAPVDLYRTGRSMGYYANVSLGYNLTWSFDVDANFSYVVRLHFCEYQVTKANQIVFDVYLNNQTAEEAMDVVAYAGGQAIPTYKDYVVYVREESPAILLQLHPNQKMKPEFYDARLNGIEIFKLSDAKKNLAGPNPSPSDMLVKAEAEAAKSFERPTSQGLSDKTHLAVVIGSAAGGAVGLSIVAALGLALYTRKKHKGGFHTSSGSWLPLYSSSGSSGSRSTFSAKSSNSSHYSSKDGGLCRHFTLPEIIQATNNFDASYVIGVGGFGNVYKGVIDGNTKVAIKRSNPSSEQGVNEFQTEIELLSKLRHGNLVSLIGFCEEDGEMALVYDFMAYGTLREHLYKNNKTNLTWKQRLEISIGAARGLHYLHTGARQTIIHRDVKTTNILLDEKWVAKVSDFGLSKSRPEMNQSHVSTVVKGSFGYLDPEYFRRQQLTEKSDVYSFGVVLFEVICARPAINPALPKEQVSLGEWALNCIKNGTFRDIIDPKIKGEIKPECLDKFVAVAAKCLADQGIHRPSMGDVLWSLEFALQLQINDPAAKTSTDDAKEDPFPNRNMGLHISNLSLGSDVDLKGNSNDPNDEIFSQMVNPTGR